jgi:hypothetical protein
MYSFETSGNVTIIIRTLQPVNLMGINYQKGDVVTVFEHAFFTLEFENNNKAITQGAKNLTHYNTMYLNYVTIEPKSLTHSAYNFIAAKFKENEKIYIPVKENITSDATGNVFLNYIPLQTKTLFIKNDKKENVTGFTVDYGTGLITGLTAETEYLCFYYREEESLVTYELKESSTPYFSIEILGQNNINNINREMLITIPRASIDINTTFEFKEEQITAIQLNFLVIDGIATVDYY